jgi:hypothetical protein
MKSPSRQNLHAGTTPRVRQASPPNEAFRDKTVGLVSLATCLTMGRQSRIEFLLCCPDPPTARVLGANVEAGSSAPAALRLGSAKRRQRYGIWAAKCAR